MIDVATAKRLLGDSVKPLNPASRPLSAAYGLVIAKPITAKLDSPRFDQSAVDGYALIGKGCPVDGKLRFEVVGELKAGAGPISKTSVGTAYRIFTGAPVPSGAYCVVMQEHVMVSNGLIEFSVDHCKSGANIRRRANHFKKGQRLLDVGLTMGPAAIGLLTAQGFTRVSAYPHPRISILVTGDELVASGSKLPPGSIYESNGPMLCAALEQQGFDVERVQRCVDDRTKLKKKIQSLLATSDMLIVTGGISVGKYDLVKSTLEQLGVKTLFHKVSQKPGKPLYAGVKQKKIVFGLPGNPAAVLVCFLQYVLPALKLQAGQKDAFPSPVAVPLAHPIHVKGDRDQFLRGKLQHGQLLIDSAQDSDNLLSFATADRLVHIPAGVTSLSAGESVDTYSF
ncbi:MAG: gephyrin-like molybdotransferase Glp [Bacteroidota bacterium]